MVKAKIKISPYYRHVHDRVILRFPIFDICRWYVNIGPNRRYRAEESRKPLSPIQQAILSELEQNGIAITTFKTLFPTEDFAKFQQIAEGLLQSPDVLTRTEEIRRGKRSMNPGKFYLVKPMGSFPVFDSNDVFLRLALKNQILGKCAAISEPTPA
jgi:hypothetical protein